MRAQELLSTLSLKQKIGQLVQLYGRYILRRNPETGEPVKDIFALTDEERASIGSFLDNSTADGSLAEWEAFLSDEIGGQIPPLCMHDVIHGCDTIFPVAIGQACSFSPALMRESARVAGLEAAAHNIHTVFAPMADLARDARWGRIMESYGEDPFLNGLYAAAAVEGFHDADITCCVKHMAAYGAVEAGREYNTVQMGERMLREQYLPAYQKAIEAGADMVMTSYTAVNDIPATANRQLMVDILRKEWGFTGLVVSDSGAIREMIPHGFAKDKKEAALLAMRAQVDIDMSSDCYLRSLEDLVNDGSITEAQIDEACLRVLQLKERMGLLDGSATPATLAEREERILKEDDLQLAEECAVQSAVLLKNDGVLPLADTVKKLAVIGPFADTEEILGNWICFGEKQYGKRVIPTVKEALQQQMPGCDLRVEEGCSWQLEDATTDFRCAVEAARESEAVVLCLGEHQSHSGEGNSRANIALPQAQLQLAKEVIAANPNTAVLLFCGRPLAIAQLSELAPAILCMWQPGTRGAAAAASLLLGKRNPSGKLTACWPRQVGQCPIYYNRTNTGRPCWAENGQKTRSMTSNYIDEYTQPLFSFGHGLSYSRFVYGKAELDRRTMTAEETVTVSVTVKNDGPVTGTETVQLYIRDLFASVVRPIKELKAFQKIMLAPGEETTVSFTIDEPMLRFWRADMTFGSEPGEFAAMVGGSSMQLDTQNFWLE